MFFYLDLKILTNLNNLSKLLKEKNGEIYAQHITESLKAIFPIYVLFKKSEKDDFILLIKKLKNCEQNAPDYLRQQLETGERLVSGMNILNSSQKTQYFKNVLKLSNDDKLELDWDDSIGKLLIASSGVEIDFISFTDDYNINEMLDFKKYVRNSKETNTLILEDSPVLSQGAAQRKSR